MTSDSRKIVVFSPHPDDDVLACGGTIALKAREGFGIFIVYMTDGRHSLSHVLGITADPSPEQVSRVRQEEALAAVRVLGIPHAANLIFLGFEDGTLESHIGEATTTVKSIIERIAPIQIYYPSKLDSHRDHRSTNMIVTTAVNQIGAKPRQFEYVVWGDGEEESGAKGSSVRVRIADVLELKREAVHQHKSQVTTPFPSQSKPVLGPEFVQRFLSEYEEFCEVS
jgi:LmbE family N-acetylglucosaminyl deacetylase